MQGHGSVACASGPDVGDETVLRQRTGIGRSIARERDIYHTVIRRITRVACLRIDGWTTAPLSDRAAADEGGERAAGRVILDADS